jgi:hypothetical protein
MVVVPARLSGASGSSKDVTVRLVLNFSPIGFDDREISVGRLPYGDDGEQILEQLREQNHATHVFRRDGACSILAVPVAPEAPLIGEAETILLCEHLPLAAALIRNTLLNGVASLGRTSLTYEPMKVVSRRDLLRISCPPGIAPPNWLSVRLLYELAIRPIYFSGHDHFIAALLDVRTTRLIERTAAELIGDGMCLDGLYVGRRVPSKDPRISADFELVGCVRSVEGSQLRLTDFRDGFETVDANSVWPAKDAFAACVSHVFKERSPAITTALECERAALRQGPERLDRIRSVLDTLRKRQHEMAPGAPFTFGPLLDDSMPTFPHLATAPRPVYVYDGRGSKTHRWHDEGLNTHGPYSSDVQTIAAPRICVICQRSQKGQVDQFLRKFFFDGVKLPPPSPHYKGKPSKNYFEKGLCRKYVLGTVHYEYFLAEGPSADSYRRACQEALEKHGSGQSWDMALIQIEESFHELPPESNPYFVAKLSFQTLQILVQEFEIETARNWGSQLSFCLNNMGLATYAKLGGIPWLLKANSKGIHEFVIGIGSAEVGVGRLGKREKLVGITTVFGGDGNYHLSNLSKAVPIDEYQDALLKTLRAAILNVRTGMNWQQGDRVLFVFHAKFKRFSKKEVQAVVDLISEFEEYDVKYAFVQVSDQHPYMAFDTDQDGVKDFETRRSKGQYAPTRGKYLQLGNREVLLFLTGPNEVKRPEDGTPQPLLLSLHRDSSFTDMPYLAEQAYAFACHSWRTFLPGSLPVTIQYPNLIANSLGKLSRLDRWNPDVMLDRIGKTMWFL